MSDATEQKKIKIILAEDDKFISRAYKDGLERAGFIVIPVMDGVTALEKIKQEKPDMVLLDLIMPVKNGFEVLKDIKADDAIKNIPIIILSNLGQDSDIEKGRELGAADYLIKSNFSMNEVIEKIKGHLKIS